MDPHERNKLNSRWSTIALILSAAVAVVGVIAQALREG